MSLPLINNIYRECLTKISRLLTDKDVAELILRYDLNATPQLQPALVLRALEKKQIIPDSKPSSVTSLLQLLDNEAASNEWQTSFMDMYALSSSDSSSNSECDHFGMSSPDIQGHMKNALEVAQNSMDTNTKVGAVIICQDGKIICGYNHMPGEKAFSWSRQGNWLDTKYPYVIEAAVDAINKCEVRSDLVGAILVTTLRPGNISCMQIVEAKIKEVWYYEDKHKNMDHIIAGERILSENGIPCKQLQILDNYE